MLNKINCYCITFLCFYFNTCTLLGAAGGVGMVWQEEQITRQFNAIILHMVVDWINEVDLGPFLNEKFSVPEVQNRAYISGDGNLSVKYREKVGCLKNVY